MFVLVKKHRQQATGREKRGTSPKTKEKSIIALRRKSPVRGDDYHLFSTPCLISAASANHPSILVSGRIATNQTAAARRDTNTLDRVSIIVAGITTVCVIDWLIGVSWNSSVDVGARSCDADCTDASRVSR
jgi:hypothetical protein